MTARARMALQQRPQPPVRDSKAIHGWHDGWGPANWSIHCSLGGQRHDRLDLMSITIPIVVRLYHIIYVRIIHTTTI